MLSSLSLLLLLLLLLGVVGDCLFRGVFLVLMLV
jgi:hypothetical protein